MASVTDANATELTSKQRRQLEKQERRRKYADLAIQGTNNSSIASKRSVERLYLQKLGVNENVDKSKGSNEYFKYFVKKPLRRSPCINRGYWLRIHAVKSRIDSISAVTTKDQRICVVNLGCGFDPLPFQLLDPQNEQNKQYQDRLSFVDLDYPDLLSNKKKIIDSTAELKEIVGTLTSSSRSDGVFEGESYTLAPCDLNNAASFQTLMISLELDDPSIIKVFVAEVSLAYMKTIKANAVITACSHLPNSHFVLLEQLLPSGPFEPFSRQMLKHFKNNDSPLQSVVDNSTIFEQQERFKKCGFPHSNIGNMYQLWESVSGETKKQIDSIESFDELEEFFLFCHHYVIGHSTNVANFPFETIFQANACDTYNDLPMQTIQVRTEPTQNEHLLQRKFGASAMLPSNEIIYSQGCYNSRLGDILSINPGKGQIEKLDVDSSKGVPFERMCHSLTSVNNGLCVMVGGRAGPNKPFSDIWLLRKSEEKQWYYEKGTLLPETRYRHSSCALNKTHILIYGGHTDGQPFLIYDSAKNELIYPDVEGNISLLSSAALAFDIRAQSGVIIGGLDKDATVQDKLTPFAYDHHSNKIIVRHGFSNPLFKRYGSKALFITPEKILIAGGFSPDVLFGQDSTLVEVSVISGQIALVRIPSQTWQDGFSMMAGFEIQKDSHDNIYLFGGGAVCYGFGSVWNPLLRIEKASTLQTDLILEKSN
ncbi:LANO_0F00650g1_1 [Lachancea nothofagi CBS 11611]|uniref:tRNA wybutosine-synthesizing protein 4 n=1 Tax=Lachancea nothofagi CBS 11611 TaxID=1266666 RepID=A0A1G4K5J4_9SACH|nr:LANO_0F00650g1_1 [Lachancea nothofagi CBS 11611]